MKMASLYIQALKSFKKNSIDKEEQLLRIFIPANKIFDNLTFISLLFMYKVKVKA